MLPEAVLARSVPHRTKCSNVDLTLPPSCSNMFEPTINTIVILNCITLAAVDMDPPLDTTRNE